MNRFEIRYAVRLPDGNLARTLQGQPWIWDSRDDAERAIRYFADYSERLGVTGWHGEVVKQLCTPWVGELDNVDHLLDELNDWLEQQIGGGS